MTIFAGIGYLVAGLAICDAQCSASDPVGTAHFIGAALGFNAILLAPLVLGLRSTGSRRNGLTIGALAIGILYWLAILTMFRVVAELPKDQFGALQKAIILLLCAWIALVSIDVRSRAGPTAS